MELQALREQLAERDAAIADRDASIADRDARLADRDASLADRDAQLAAGNERHRHTEHLLALERRRVKLDDCLQYVALTKIDTSAQAFGASRGLWRDDVQMHWALAKARYGPRRMTRLHWAAAKGYVARVVELLEWSSDIEARDEEGATELYDGDLASGSVALDLASANGHVEVVLELLRCGAKVNTKDDAGSSPLHKACCGGRLEVVRALLDAGAVIEARNNVGASPLHGASMHGKLEVVRELLTRGAAMEARDEVGDVPLQLAAFEGHAGVVRELLVRGADAGARDTEQRTSLHGASVKNRVSAMRELLKRAETDVNAQGDDGHTALHDAALGGHLAACTLLVAHGASLALLNAVGDTPLRVAKWRVDQDSEEPGEDEDPPTAAERAEHVAVEALLKAHLAL